MRIEELVHSLYPELRVVIDKNSEPCFAFDEKESEVIFPCETVAEFNQWVNSNWINGRDLGIKVSIHVILSMLSRYQIDNKYLPLHVILHEVGHYYYLKKNGINGTFMQNKLENFILKNNQQTMLSLKDLAVAYRNLPTEKIADTFAILWLKKYMCPKELAKC